MESEVMLEFFAGSGQMAAAFQARGYRTLTIDNNPELKPDLCTDILNFKKEMLPREYRQPMVAWFSPPCTRFSVCVISRHWKNGRPATADRYIALALAQKCLEIIKELKPRYWFIENPRGMLRKQHFMADLPRQTVTYCQYGETYQKPTDIWTNCSSWIGKKCNSGDSCHEYQPRTYKTKLARGVIGLGVQGLADAYERGKIPHELCDEIVAACSGNLPQIQTQLNAPHQNLENQEAKGGIIQ